MARPDRDALESVRHIAARLTGPIVMFVDHDDHAFMEEAIAAGVSSYNVVRHALPDIRPIVRSAVALFRRYQKLQDDLHRAEAGLRDRALVERAKTILIRSRRMSEPDAHRWLQRHAMSQGRRLADIAADLVAADAAAAGTAPPPGDAAPDGAGQTQRQPDAGRRPPARHRTGQFGNVP